MTEHMHAGIIGAGFIGGVHAHAVRAAGGVIRRVASHSPEAAQQAAQRLHADGAAASAQELIAADDIDIVHVCTPNFTHAPLAQLALGAGKPVICEKPLATTVVVAWAADRRSGIERDQEMAARTRVGVSRFFVIGEETGCISDLDLRRSWTVKGPTRFFVDHAHPR